MTNTTDFFAGWRVTALCRPIYSFGHNLRESEYVETQKHIDPTRSYLNKVYIHMGDERETFEKLFGESIKKYNAKQKRKDRRITDYYEKICEDKRKGTHKNPKASSDRQPFYELQFYIGNRDSHCPDEIAKKILSLYILKVMPKKFPNFIPTSIVMHNDEYSIDRKGNRFESPLHFHVIGCYVAHALSLEELKEEMEYRKKRKKAKEAELKAEEIEWNEEEWKKKDWRKGMIKRWGKSLEKGMELQCSMSAACNEMGFFTEKEKGTAQQQFEEAVRHDLMDFAESLGVKINRTKGYKHGHREKDIYAAERNNMELEAELKETQELLKAKEIELQNQKDDFDYTIEHLEEREKKLSLKEAELVLLDEKLQKDEEKLNQLGKTLSDEKNRLEQVEFEQNARRKSQSEKEQKLKDREKNLDNREERLEEQAKQQNEREKRILQSELPLREKKRELKQKERNLSERETVISQRETQVEKLGAEIAEREKTAIKKEQSATLKELSANKELEEARKEKKEASKERQQAEELLNQNQKSIDSFNVENRGKLIEIADWEEAAEEIKDTENWVKPLFTEYDNNRHKENAFSDFFGKMTNGVKAVIAKVKKSYDEKLKTLNEKLFGRKRFYEKNSRIICEYSYGESDYADMLRDTPVSDIQKAIDETKQRGKNTFAEAASMDGGLAFYECYFEKAKTLTREREIELKRRSRFISR